MPASPASPWLSLLPVSLGLAAVVQGSLNRRIAAHLSLPGAVLLTHAVAALCALALLLLPRVAALLLPSGASLAAGTGRAAWWYLVPGLCGCAFVFGMPIAFSRLGVFQSLLLLIAAQLVVSVGWDRLIEGRAITPTQLLGALITLIGAALVLRR